MMNSTEDPAKDAGIVREEDPAPESDIPSEYDDGSTPYASFQTKPQQTR